MGSEHRGERRLDGEDGELATVGSAVTGERHNRELHRWKGLRLGVDTRELRGWEERRPAEKHRGRGGTRAMGGASAGRAGKIGEQEAGRATVLRHAQGRRGWPERHGRAERHGN